MTLTRKPYVRPPRSYPSAIPESQRRNAVYARMDVLAAPQPKEDPVRSEPYRRAVASLPCISCGRFGASQHAHTNGPRKAKGMKNDDRDAMPLCADAPGRIGCHSLFDHYALLPGGRAAHVAQGELWAVQTRAQINALGLWPAKLPQLDKGQP